MWKPANYWPEDAGASDGQWLYCLRDTFPGDRQVVWTGRDGHGIVAVVDFNGAVRPRSSGGSLYEGWGRITALRDPIPPEVVLNHPLLGPKFRHLQSVSNLDEPTAKLIRDFAGELPVAPGFDEHEDDWDEDGGTWGGDRYDPEWITHEIIAEEPNVASALGLPSVPEIEKIISPRDRADFWCPAGVVGEVKNVVTSCWGPDQIERYIAACDKRWPDHIWRGVLVQSFEYLTPSAARRLEASPYRGRLTLWSVGEDPDDAGMIEYCQLWPEG